MSIRKPRSTVAAQALCERFAELEGRIEMVEAVRNEEIARANAAADAELAPLIAERDGIAAKLEPWWGEAKAALTEGKRKSIELGGCMIGSVSGRQTLAIAGDTKVIATAMSKLAWAKRLVRVTLGVDKGAVTRALAGPRRGELEAMGFSLAQGEESFFVKRTEQTGTRT